MPEAVKFKYLYNGKELQDELGLNVYDYGARTYDPAAPRFWQIDPLAEKYHNQSVYVHADDNPVRFMDIDGKGTEDNFIFDTKGNLIERVKNDSPDRFFVRKQIQKKMGLYRFKWVIYNISNNNVPRQMSGSMTLFLLFYYNKASPSGLFNKLRRGEIN